MTASAPAWGYRRAADGTVEARLFPEGRPETGWADSPARVDAAPAPAVAPAETTEPPKRRRGRPRKAG